MFALVKNETRTDIATGDTVEVQIINLFAPHTIWADKNGTQYSPDSLLSLTVDQKQDLGIYDVAYAARPDDRFYNTVENAPTFDPVEKIVKITFTSTAKDLDDTGTPEFPVLGLKNQYISQFKQTANNLLSQTDWMLVRKIERDVAIPAATVTYRAAVVTEVNRLETAITAATTVAQLITAVESASFPSAE
jgi:hypothetical protein